MPTVIIPPTDVSPYTGTGDQVLATNPVFPSNITVSGTTDSSSKDTGAIVTEGGLGVEKSATIGGNLTVSGTGTSTLAGQVTSFANAGTASNLGSFVASNATLNSFTSYSPSASLDQKYWTLQAGTAVGDGVIRLRALNDAGTNGINALIITRTGISSTAVEVGGNLTVSGGTIGTAASTNLTLNGGSSGASLALGQGTTGTFTFTLPSISAGNTTWVSAGAVGIGVDFKRATATATLGGTLASLNGYNGATRSTIFEFNGDGATDSGRFDWWVKPTAGSLTQAMVLKSNGNLLLGTTTDSGNGKLQLATHTTSAGGIGFGTDISLWRNGTESVLLGGATTSLLGLAIGGSRKAYFYHNGTQASLSSETGALVLLSNATTALTLDSSQNATFAKSVTVSGGDTTVSAGKLKVYTGNVSSWQANIGSGANSGLYINGLATTQTLLGAGMAFESPNWIARGGTTASGYHLNAGAHAWYGDTGLTDGASFTPTLRMSLSTAGNLTLTGSLTTSAPTGGAGAWELGVYTATAPTATGYVTIEIGGVQYKLLAST